MSKYESRDVTFIIPTKDRPEKIRNVLNSLAMQTAVCGRVIVVASGQDISDVVNRFAEKLHVEYYTSDIPGQLRQRNYGIDLIGDDTKLVGFLDDDIVLESDALERLIDYWNQNSRNTAGVGFCIFSESYGHRSRIKNILKRRIPKGKVLKSGYNTSISDLDQSIESQWLNGGTTVWKKEILSEFRHSIINTQWAICEDLIFSYPIGKKNRLLVCAEARVRHDHKIDVSRNDYNQQDRGMKWALWILYFIESNDDLSRFHFYFSVFFTSLLGIAIGSILPAKRGYIRFYYGKLVGAFRGFIAIKRNTDLISLLEEY